MRAKYFLLLVLNLMIFIAAACVQSWGNSKPLSHDAWENIDMMISDYILRTDFQGTVKGEKAFEVHKLYGIYAEETNIYVYALVLYEQYNFEHEKLKNVLSRIEPAIFILKQNNKSKYIVDGCTKPECGQEYYENIEKIFPDRYSEQIWQDINSDNYGGLAGLMNDKVKEGLEKQEDE